MNRSPARSCSNSSHTEAKLGILGEELDRMWEHQLKPTCTLIPVPRLALDEMLFEVEAVAVLPV